MTLDDDALARELLVLTNCGIPHMVAGSVVDTGGTPFVLDITQLLPTRKLSAGDHVENVIDILVKSIKCIRPHRPMLSAQNLPRETFDALHHQT